MDCKATVKIGEFSHGGLTRGDNRASDHDLGCQEKYVPCGIVDEGSGELAITFGSSYKTSDFIVDTIAAKWKTMDEQEKAGTSLVQIKMDNGPESSGRRTQFLYRMVQLADEINKPIQLLYYPPYHSKYNPIERCWGIPTVSLDVTYALAYTYGSDDGRIWSVRCAVIVAGLGDR